MPGGENAPLTHDNRLTHDKLAAMAADMNARGESAPHHPMINGRPRLPMRRLGMSNEWRDTCYDVEVYEKGNGLPNGMTDLSDIDGMSGINGHAINGHAKGTSLNGTSLNGTSLTSAHANGIANGHANGVSASA